MRADGSDQNAIRLQPAQQRLRDFHHRRGRHDAVEAAKLGRDIEAVAQDHLDIAAAELLQARAGNVSQRAEALDRHHLPGEVREHCGLVARAGPDLEHPMTFLQLELLGHIGHNEGLADRLSAAYAECAVAVGVAPVAFLHKGLARHIFHRTQDRLVADPPPPQGELKHHFFGRGHAVVRFHTRREPSVPNPKFASLLPRPPWRTSDSKDTRNLRFQCGLVRKFSSSTRGKLKRTFRTTTLVRRHVCAICADGPRNFFPAGCQIRMGLVMANVKIRSTSPFRAREPAREPLAAGARCEPGHGQHDSGGHAIVAVAPNSHICQREWHGQGTDIMTTTRPPRGSVFLVEDEVMIRMMVADMLNELGYTVAAEAGEIGEAIRLAQTTYFDVAILDVNVNGKVISPVADLLKARGRPFIFATGYGSSGLPEEYRDRPALQKPFQLETLGKMIDTTLRGATA